MQTSKERASQFSRGCKELDMTNEEKDLLIAYLVDTECCGVLKEF